MRPAMPPSLLHATLFVSGAVVMVLELLGTRLLAPLYGTGLPVWSAQITVTLAALAVGYWSGGALADRRPSAGPFLAILVLAALATLLVRPLATPVLQATSGLGLRAGVLVAAALLFGPALALLGMLGPFACRLHPAHAAATGRAVGRLYAVSTAGSVAGALLAGNVLAPALPLGRIFQLAALALAAMAVVGAVVTRRRRAAAGALAVLATAALPAGHPALPRGVRLVRDDQSFFQRVQTIDADGQRWLLLDGLVHTHVLLEGDDPVRCEYARAAELVPAVRAGARRFLAIGCGGGAMIRLLQGGDRTFDVVELDEAVVRAAREDFGAAVPGAVFHAGDGRAFLRGGGTWDAALVDVVSTETMPEHLSSSAFFGELKRALRPGGVALFNSIGAPGGAALASFGRTLAAAFGRVRGFTAHLEEGATNVVWLATDGPLELPEALREAYEPRAYDPGPGGIVLTDDHNPVNAWNAELGLAFRRRLHDWLGPGLAAAR